MADDDFFSQSFSQNNSAGDNSSDDLDFTVSSSSKNIFKTEDPVKIAANKNNVSNLQIIKIEANNLVMAINEACNSNMKNVDLIVKVLEYEVPDLLNTRKFAELEPVVKNPITSPFIWSLNKSLQSLAISLLGIVKARDCFDHVLELVTAGSDSAKHIAQIGVGIQTALATFNLKTNNLVQGFIKVSKESGKIAYVLEYGANPEVLQNRMAQISSLLVGNDTNFQDTLTKATKQIELSLQWITKNLVRDTVVQEFQKRIAKTYEEYKTEQEAYDIIYKQWWDKYHILKGEEKGLENEIASLKRREENLHSDLIKHNKIIDFTNKCIQEQDEKIKAIDYDQKAEDNRINELENESNEQLNVLLKNIEKTFKTQFENLEKEHAEINKNLVQLKELEANADPGGEFVEKETNAKSWGWWIFSWDEPRTTHHKTTIRPNKQIHYTRLIEHRNRELIALKNHKKEINDDNSRVLANIKRDRHAIAASASTRKNENAKSFAEKKQLLFQCREKIMDYLKELTNMKQKLDNKMIILERSRGKVEQELQKVQLLLEEHEKEPKTKLNNSENIKNNKHQIWQNEVKLLEDKLRYLQETHGQSQYSFIPFMQSLRSLHYCARNLSTSFQKMSMSFESAKSGLATEAFKETYELIPEDKRSAALLRLAQQFQTACNVGQAVIQQPMEALLLRDAKPMARLNLNSNVVVEEVDE